MARAFGAFPEYRHPFEATPIHPEGSATILYQDKAVTLTEIGQGPGSAHSAGGPRSRERHSK